jgi:hypothetical protein
MLLAIRSVIHHSECWCRQRWPDSGRVTTPEERMGSSWSTSAITKSRGDLDQGHGASLVKRQPANSAEAGSAESSS